MILIMTQKWLLCKSLVYILFSIAILPNLELKTSPKQHLGSFPADIDLLLGLDYRWALPSMYLNHKPFWGRFNPMVPVIYSQTY
jgi:hypothetical protein